MRFWQHWKYKNLTLVFLGISLAFIISKNNAFHQFLLHLGEFGYVGAFIAGILFVSVFTVATGAIILFALAEYLHPIELAIIAGLGAVIGDLTIFRLVKNDLLSEINEIYTHHLNGRYLTPLFHTKYFSWMLPVIGAIIIASPFPDELGITLMGISKMKTISFLLISFFLNSFGIFLIITGSLILNR